MERVDCEAVLVWVEWFSLLLWLIDTIVVKVLYDKGGKSAIFFVDVYKERLNKLNYGI